MEIKFNCTNPACNQRIAVETAYAGRSIHCPGCNATLQVPHLPAVEPSAPVFVEAIPVEAADAPALAKPPGISDEAIMLRLWSLVKGWSLGAALLGVVVVILYLHSRSELPRNLDALLDETYFHGEILIAPVVNNAGTKLAYVRTTESGVGVFLVNLDTLDRKQIALAKPANKTREGAVKLFGWSPDDRYLAFSALQKGAKTRTITICDGMTGAVTNSFTAPYSVETGKWLARSSLVMMDEVRNLFLLNLEADSGLGQFGRKGFVKLRQLDKSGSWPIPDSSRSVAYVEKGNVWTLDLPANKLTQLTHLTNATISWLDYSADSFRYLFGAKIGNSAKQTLYQFNLREAATSALTRLNPTNFFTKGQWIQDGLGMAYVGTEGGRYFLGVNSKSTALQTNLFTAPPFNPKQGLLNKRLFPEGKDVVRTFSVNPKRDKIYTVAAVDYTPLTIWEYDISARTLRNVLPDTDRMDSPIIAPVQASLTNGSGNRIDYYYLPPAGLKRDKKYPVVMDQFSDLGYQPNSQFLAKAGILYVTANRYGMDRPEYPTDPENTLAVYNEIIKNPNVDPKRIYLFGESAGTGTVAMLLESRPELWRGAIMLSPVAFPRMESGTKMCPSIFFSFGENDSASTQKRMEQFARQACAHLVRTQIIYGHAGHIFFDINELKKRYKAIATFILADY